MHRTHVWQGIVEGGELAGRHFTLTERDGASVYVASHCVRGRPETVTTIILRGDEALEEYLAERGARVVWRRLWRTPLAA